jgi:hypothetical protein
MREVFIQESGWKKKKLKTSQAADLLDIPLGGEGKNDRSPKWDGYLAAVQVLFG